MSNNQPTLVVTSGEPAGIGPDVVLHAAQASWPGSLVVIGDETLLQARSKMLGLETRFQRYNSAAARQPHQPGTVQLIHLPTASPVTAGCLDPLNAGYVLAQLELAVSMCRAGEADALVTAPVHKGVINDSGFRFTGHTEFLAEATQAEQVVMMLVSGSLRVALATTHLPLRQVSDAISFDGLSGIIKTVHEALITQFGVKQPRITVLGLNPHAGENGHLGREEIDIIQPACQALQKQGLTVRGPLPADSAFTEAERSNTDAYIAMYHDQGLPVLKALGFGDAANVTLGMPIIRTSVDHGTALSLAGSGKAGAAGMKTAIQTALELCAVSAG